MAVCLFKYKKNLTYRLRMNFYLLFQLIAANYGGKTHSKRLPAIEKVSAFWSFIEGLMDDLSCCESFYSSQPASQVTCQKCSKSSTSSPGSSGHRGKIAVKCYVLILALFFVLNKVKLELVNLLLEFNPFIIFFLLLTKI